MAVFLLADRGLEGDRLLGDLQDLADTVDGHIHLLGDLFRGWFAAELLQQLSRDADQLVDRLNHVDRDADRAGLVRDCAGDRLADPPCRVCGELEAFAVVVFFNSLDETEVSFLDQVEEQHAAADIALRDGDNQTKVGLREPLLGLLADLAALLHLLGELDLLLGGEKRHLADLLQIHTDRVLDGDAFRDREVDLLDVDVEIFIVFDIDLIIIGNEKHLVVLDIVLHAEHVNPVCLEEVQRLLRVLRREGQSLHRISDLGVVEDIFLLFCHEKKLCQPFRKFDIIFSHVVLLSNSNAASHRRSGIYREAASFSPLPVCSPDR